MASSSGDNTLPLSTMVHIVTIKLTSSNYLLWHAQMLPLLASQKLLSYVDGSKSPPSRTVTKDNVESNNPEYVAWNERDQLIKLLLISTLNIEEAMALVIGCSSARDVWQALITAYSQSSNAREITLKDEMMALKHGERSVAEYEKFPH